MCPFSYQMESILPQFPSGRIRATHSFQKECRFKIFLPVRRSEPAVFGDKFNCGTGSLPYGLSTCVAMSTLGCVSLHPVILTQSSLPQPDSTDWDTVGR